MRCVYGGKCWRGLQRPDLLSFVERDSHYVRFEKGDLNASGLDVGTWICVDESSRGKI